MTYEIRSNKQNKYYWGIVLLFISIHKRITPHEAHEWVKTTWNVTSTSTLDTVRFDDLMRYIRVHTNKFWRIFIPKPNEGLEDLENKMPAEQLYYHFNPRNQKG